MRRKDEAILIGDDIIIKVLKIQGDQIHLGIKAPKDVKIWRNEIQVKIDKQNNKE